MQQLAEMVHIRDVAYAERVAEIAESIYSHLNSNISRIGTEILGMSMVWRVILATTNVF